jgi:hypothetical protein
MNRGENLLDPNLFISLFQDVHGLSPARLTGYIPS